MSSTEADSPLTSETDELSSQESLDNVDYSSIEKKDQKGTPKSKDWGQKLPFMCQSIVFTIAYFELSKMLLKLLNKYIFKFPLVFQWNIYKFIKGR